jgi:hypothetical protein
MFEVAAGSGAITNLASFNTTTGGEPWGDLVGYGGNFYGATANGGADSYGTVFEYQVLAPTATSVAPGTATVSYGQSATFTATVSSSAGVPPDGSVQFLVNGVAYGSPVALSGATAQLAISEPAGSYTIAAQYTGDANYAATLPAAETTAALTVVQAATATSVAPNTATVSYGQSATFTATVSSSAGVPPDGSVQFLVNGAAYGSPVALSGATAQLAISEPAGSYTIAAQYTGDANYAVTVPAAEITGTLTVNQSSTTTTAASASTTFDTAAQTVVLSAAVTSPTGPVNEGTETFLYRGGHDLERDPVAQPDRQQVEHELYIRQWLHSGLWWSDGSRCERAGPGGVGGERRGSRDLQQR